MRNIEDYFGDAFNNISRKISSKTSKENAGSIHKEVPGGIAQWIFGRSSELIQDAEVSKLNAQRYFLKNANVITE